MDEPECDGICVYGYELLEDYGGDGVAYAHPDCPLHGRWAPPEEGPSEAQNGP